MSNTYGCAPQVAGSAAPSFIVGSRISCVWVQDGCCDKVKAYKKTVTDAVGIVTVSYFDAADCVTPIVGPVVEVSDPTIPDVVAAVQALASANSGPVVAADPCCPATNALLQLMDNKLGLISGNTDQLETLQAGTTTAVNAVNTLTTSTNTMLTNLSALTQTILTNSDGLEGFAQQLGLQTDQLEPLLTDIKALLAKEPDCNNEPALRVFDKCVQQALLQVVKNTADDIIKGCLPAQTLPTVLPQRTVDVVRTKQLSGAYAVTAVYETVEGQMVSIAGPWPTLKIGKCPEVAIASTEPTADIVNCGTGKSLSVSECATSALTVSSQATTAATQSSAALLIQINNLQTTANNLQSGANLIATNAANSSANQNAAQLDELQAIKANTLATNLSVGSATSAQIAGNNLASVGQTATAAQATATQTILNEIKGFEQAGNAVDIAQNALVNAKLEQIRLALVATETLTATTKRTPSNPYTITANAQSYSVLAYSNDVTVSGSPIKQGTVVSVSVDRLQRIGSSANVTGADFLVTEIR